MALAATAPSGSPKRTESTAVRGIVTRQLSHDGDWKYGTPLIESVVMIRLCSRAELTRSLDAQVHRLHGRMAAALQALEGATTDVWYQHAIASPFFAGTFDRYLRASLLAEAGRPTEARAWLNSLCQRSARELPFRAAAEALIKELP